MTPAFNDIWETYVNAWNDPAPDKKQHFFQKCLTTDCHYNDPQTSTSGHTELAEYMKAFHEQFPDCYFKTTWFLAHSQKSIARWEMKQGDSVLGDGVSYAEYNDDGMLTSMTGFFETP